MDLVSASISDPVGCEVLFNTIGWWEWDRDFDDYEFSKKVDIDACWFEEECMICNINLDLEPGGTYVISARIFDDHNESAVSNEIPFTLPVYFD
ncbi:MAG: hypothetical protein U9O82_06310 [Thermodesulfobacteriota bacterium]|nr:hypothetical protein [Thermodesulfobacteriota bacterium]